MPSRGRDGRSRLAAVHAAQYPRPRDAVAGRTLRLLVWVDYKGHGAAIALVPRRTGAVGPIFQAGGLYASLLAKYVGPQYLQDAGFKDLYPIRSCTDADLSLGCTLPAYGGRSLSARLNVFNLFDDHALIGLPGVAGDGVTPLYTVNPGRSLFVTLSAAL